MKKLLWSNYVYDMFDEETIEKMDIDSLYDIIVENFNNIFEENEHKYAGLCVGSMNLYGLGSDNRGRRTEFFSNMREILDWGMNAADIVRFYVEKHNHLMMECSHHDGKETLQIIRLNKKGRERMQNYYDENEMLNNSADIRNYISVSCWNDFKQE